jgi:hypothetical protein
MRKGSPNSHGGIGQYHLSLPSMNSFYIEMEMLERARW